MHEDNLAKIAKGLIAQAEAYRDLQKGARDRALAFYQGEESSVPAQDSTKATVVSKDLRAVVRKIMPSVMRTLLSNDRVVEYHPRRAEGEAQARQATDYVNAVVIEESGAERAIYDAVMDALLLKTGILTWAAYEENRVVEIAYRDQGEEQMLGLDLEGEVLDRVISGQGEDGAPLYSFRLRRSERKICTRLRAVPRGAFLIHPNARSLEDSPIVGETQEIKRSDLVARGYDKDLVWSLKADDDGEDDAKERRGEDWAQVEADVAKAVETVKVSDIIVQHDADGDGIAELHHLVVGEGFSEGLGREDDSALVILHHELVAEVNYADVVAERDAHQFEGHSLAEDVIEAQRVNTVLLRQAIDNVIWANNPQLGVKLEMVENPEALLKPRFSQPIYLKPGTMSVADVLSWQQVPFIADKAFAAMEAMKAETKERTGISDAAGGLSAEQLQNTSATASAMINDAAMAQAEMMIRSIARGGLKRAFKGLLKLIIANADAPRALRLRGEWVEFDPRAWDADMDCTVNIGLGGGSRERDLGILQMILAQQKDVLASLGAENPLVKPDQVYNTLAKMVEIAGFPNADPFFTAPKAEGAVGGAGAALLGGLDLPALQGQLQALVMQGKEQVQGEMQAILAQQQMQAELALKRVTAEAQETMERQKLLYELQIARLEHKLQCGAAAAADAFLAAEAPEGAAAETEAEAAPAWER